MKKRGQIAFESLFILLIVLTAAIAIGNYYLQYHDDNMALIAARAETLNQLGAKNSSAIIESISITPKGVNADINITITPAAPPNLLDTALISHKVAQVSKYKSATINLQ